MTFEMRNEDFCTTLFSEFFFRISDQKPKLNLGSDLLRIDCVI